MFKQVRLELFKLSRRARSYLGFCGLAGLAGLMVLGLAQGPPPFSQSVSQGFVSAGSFLNSGFVAWFLLKFAQFFFLPLFACVVVGDMVSSESADGTLRTLLSRPVSRASVFGAKYATSVLYVFALTFAMGIAAYIIGAIFLGRGTLTTFQEGTLLGAQGIYIFPETEGLLRLAAAHAFVSLGAMSVASIAFLLSAFVSNSLGAIGGAMMTLIAFQVMGMFEFFEPVSGFFFTKHMDSWNGFFVNPVPWAQVAHSAGVLGAYCVVSFALGVWLFSRKDILT